ncbi:MAG: DUF3343 domain-containing protein [bacterium]|nr:DUF3343 domain-containing protein [bacterium]
MAEPELNYYVLFDNFTQGLALQELLQNENIPARISPTPHILQGELSCGMSLLVLPQDIDSVRACIAEHGAAYHSITALPCQIRRHRDRFC